jgi:hypothetical protein
MWVDGDGLSVMRGRIVFHQRWRSTEGQVSPITGIKVREE